MIMSGNGERVVFVHARPGDEAVTTGGTIARLRGDDAQVALAYGCAVDAAPMRRALGALGVTDWRVLPEEPGADDAVREGALRAMLDELGATAVVVGGTDVRLRNLATRVAQAAGVPVFLSCRVAEATGTRLTAIDVSDFVDEKRAALAAYPKRWTVEGGDLVLADGARQPISGTETYVRLDAPREAPAAAPRARMPGRLAGATVALLCGAFVGVLGTIAHQATLTLGALTLPVGLVLALLASGTLLVGLRLVLHDRLIVGACAAGLLATVFVLSLRGSGGSVLVPEGLPGSLWTLVPALVAVLVLAWPQIPARRGSA